MSGAGGGDVLDRWLRGEGLATLDHLMGGALDVVGVVDRELVVRYVNWTVPGLTREAVVGNSVQRARIPGTGSGCSGAKTRTRESTRVALALPARDRPE